MLASLYTAVGCRYCITDILGNRYTVWIPLLHQLRKSKASLGYNCQLQALVGLLLRSQSPADGMGGSAE